VSEEKIIKKIVIIPDNDVRESITQTKIVKKAWGQECIVENTKDYCAKLMTLIPNGECSLHFHKKKKETFTLITGCMTVTTVNIKTGKHTRTFLHHPGDSITICPYTPHSFKPTGKSYVTFFETSTKDSPNDSVRMSQSTGPGLDSIDKDD